VYKLGILDQSPVFPGTQSYDGLQKTVHLAQKAEEWGYSRFWVSEHHHAEEVAGSSPEVLISYLLARTNSIRIGSGGVMLQHYSPFKVAENFHVLSSLAPGRVDLGIGKAPGGLPLSTKALQYGNSNNGILFEERLSLLKKITENSVGGDHPLAGIKATPIPPKEPEIFLLGASANSAGLAADFGIGFVFALFLNSDMTALEESARVYHSLYPDGRFIVSAHVLAAPTQEEAVKLAGEQKIIKVYLQSGRSVTVTSLEQAKTFGEQSGELYEIKEQEAYIIAGTPSYVKGTLTELHQTYQVDEFILHTSLQKETERTRSFQLLSPNYSIVDKSNEEKDEQYVG
jgi:luciferase family oxidoreductase group 1